MQYTRIQTAVLCAASLAALPMMGQVMGQAPEDADDWAHPPIIVAGGNVGGYTPTQLRSAYGFSQLSNQGKGQTIALVDAFDNPDAASDLATFSSHFSLPACGAGCFQKIYAAGTQPTGNRGWAGESSLDIEWAHAIAPQAKIILVEASGASNKALLQAVDVAVQNGASVVSMSWGGREFTGEVNSDSHFNVSGVTFCASSGDSGHGAQYPAASPLVVAVGGTALELNGNKWSSEKAWNGSGGGTSKYETEPSYQAGAQNTGKRGIPDVAYDASPATGVPVYSQYGFGGWIVVGGTSMSAPEWAALFAIANSMRDAKGKGTLNQVQVDLYPNAADFHDITTGTNGSCSQCKATKGYDFVTGIGSPEANLLIPALVAAP
jgi:subtilase family serine protease